MVQLAASHVFFIIIYLQGVASGFYCHALICLVVNSLLIQRSMGNTVEKLN